MVVLGGGAFFYERGTPEECTCPRSRSYSDSVLVVVHTRLISLKWRVGSYAPTVGPKDLALTPLAGVKFDPIATQGGIIRRSVGTAQTQRESSLLTTYWSESTKPS